jgi:methyl-accepting chemotaxis protein
MVRVASIVGIALTFVMMVFASDGVVVNGTVSKWHIPSDKLTILPEIMNSTDSASLTGLNYDRFLGPDSKVDPTLQTAILKFKELETAPSCNKMASSALIFTCATFKGDGEAPDSTEKTLDEEKSLFGARLAVCELLDSDDNHSLVPSECTSFIPTKSNTKKKGWIGYVQEKLIPRYPDYDQATRQDRGRCVTALKKSPQTWSSYSNAKQSANLWCPAVRGDIERDEMLQRARAVVENLVLQGDVIRSHNDILHEQKEAFQFLTTQLIKFTHDTLKSHEAFQQMSSDALASMQAAMENAEIQLQARIARSMAALEELELKGNKMVESVLSTWKDTALQHNTEIALAGAKAAEDARLHLEFQVEMLSQHVQQILFNAGNTGHEVAVGLQEVVQHAQQLRYEIVSIGEEATTVNEFLSDVTRNAQQLRHEHVELNSAMNDTRNHLAALNSEVLSISNAAAVFTGFSDRLQAAALYGLLFIGTVAFLLFLCLGGWRILVPVISRMIKLITLAFNKLIELAHFVLLAAGNFLSSAMSAAQQCVDWKVALLLILGVAGIAFYFVAVETPTAYWLRLGNGDVSLFEPANIAVIGTIVLVFLCAISSRVTAFRESEFLQPRGFESYDDKESAV